jgi:hypothetical protein
MIDENTVQDTAKPDSAPAAAPEKEEADTPEDNTEDATPEVKADDKPELSDDEKAKVASEAAKVLNERKRSAQKRIDEAVFKQRNAERRAAQLQRELNELRARNSPPDPAQFQDDAGYTAAQVDHRLNEREAARTEKQIEDAERERVEALGETWRTRTEEYKAEVQDFDDIVYGKLNNRISGETAFLIAELEEGPAVAYYLGKNLVEASRIDRLSGHAKAIALGDLQGRIRTPAPRRVTTAPAPVNSLTGKSKVSTPSYSNMSMAEYAKVVAKEMAK